MTELSREQIESVRVLAQHYDGTEVQLFGVSVRALCDMALAKKDAEQRAQRAEAECERLRGYLEDIARNRTGAPDWLAQKALATPPPEGGSESWAGTWDEQADVPLCDWKPGMRNTPEQADSYPLDSEGRCLKCGGTGRIGVDSTREPCPACTSLPSQQAHGDALAALDRILLRGDNAKCGDFQIVRKALTASGVPEEVRRLPEKFRATGSRHGRFYANWLERALASAPADYAPITRQTVFSAWCALDSKDYRKAKAILAEALDAAAPTDGRG